MLQTSRRDTIVHEPAADGRAWGWIVWGCDTLNVVARAPSYTSDGHCQDCRHHVAFGRGHHARCWWREAVAHVLEHRCAPAVVRAQLRALLAGWRLFDGGRE